MLEQIINKIKTNTTFSYKKFLTKEEFLFFNTYIVDQYNKNVSLTQLAKELHTSRNIITKYLKNNNIEIVNKQNLLRVRDNLFKTIKNEEDAYWLGFCLADGYISDKGQFELSLKSTDYLHLHKFAKYIDYTGVIVNKAPVVCNNKTFYRCRLEFATKQLKNNFHNLGIIPRKSLIMKLPKGIPQDVFRHFVRGFFDANGCISFDARNYVAVSFSGCKFIISDIVKIIPGNFLVFSDTRRHPDYLIASSRRKFNKLFLNYIYDDCSIYLDRKYKKYIAVQNGNILNYQGAISKEGEIPNIEISN